MGIFKKLFGGADGIREAMRESYRKHIQGSRSAGASVDSPHRVGLYGALASRYRAGFRPSSEVELWAELAPFLAMPEPESVHWLSEYVVYQEMPNQADSEGLSSAINRACVSIVDPDLRGAAAFGYRAGVPWRPLLSSSTMMLLRDAARELDEA